MLCFQDEFQSIWPKTFRRELGRRAHGKEKHMREIKFSGRLIMSDIVKKRDKKVTVKWKNWGRSYKGRFSVAHSCEAIRVFKSSTEQKTLMECMVPIYVEWEKHHENGEKGVYKPSDLILHYGIKEV